MTKPKIYVGIPTPSGDVSAPLSSLLSYLVEWRHSADCPWWFTYELLSRCSPVEYARNLLVKGFLASGADWLWFLDYDLVPPENWKLLLEDAASGKADIVAGKYPNYRRDDNGELSLQMLAERDRVTLLPTDPDPFVHGAATGCMMIPRRVFEHPGVRLSGKYLDMEGRERDAWAEQDHVEAAPPFFRTVYDPAGRRIGTEDYEFCRRAGACGFTIRLSDVWWDHMKTLGLLEVNELAVRTAKRAAALIEAGT